MPEEVKAVMFKTEFFPALQCLTRGQLGAVMQAVMADALGQDMPELEPIEKMAVAMLMPSIRAAQEEYRRKCRAQSENGKKGGRPRKVEVIEESETETQKSHGFSGLSEKTQKSRIEGNRIEGNIYTPLCSTNICPPVGDAVEVSDPEKPSRKRFVKPTVEEVAAYCAERGNDVDADAFVAFYDSNGWRVGKNPMRDWKGAVRTWEQRRREDQRVTPGHVPRAATVGQQRWLEEKQMAQMVLASKIREREEREHARQIGTSQNGNSALLSLPSEFQ